MLDPAMFNQMAPQFPEHEQLKCPRCDSTNTKFCYYNNYNLSQPRHYCKNCRRYWTKGGSLRNIPVGGGTRKNSKRSSNPKRQANSGSEPELARIQKQLPIPAPQVIQNSPPVPDPTRIYGLPVDQERKWVFGLAFR